MRGRNDVEPVRRHQRRGVGAHAGHCSRVVAGARIDGFDKPGLADGDVNEAGRRVEESHIGRACNRPDVATSPEVLLISTNV